MRLPRSALVARYRPGDCQGRLHWIVVLPEAHNPPTLPRDPLRCVGVTPPVGFYLVSPELGVGLRPRSVRQATVPETTVDVNRDPLVRTYDVGPAPKAGHGRLITQR